MRLTSPREVSWSRVDPRKARSVNVLLGHIRPATVIKFDFINALVAICGVAYRESHQGRHETQEHAPMSWLCNHLHDIFTG
jgi:hypothetical protein